MMAGSESLGGSSLISLQLLLWEENIPFSSSFSTNFLKIVPRGSVYPQLYPYPPLRPMRSPGAFTKAPPHPYVSRPHPLPPHPTGVGGSLFSLKGEGRQTSQMHSPASRL